MCEYKLTDYVFTVFVNASGEYPDTRVIEINRKEIDALIAMLQSCKKELRQIDKGK